MKLCHLLCEPCVPKTQEREVALQGGCLVWREGGWACLRVGDIGEKVGDNWEGPDSLAFGRLIKADHVYASVIL